MSEDITVPELTHAMAVAAEPEAAPEAAPQAQVSITMEDLQKQLATEAPTTSVPAVQAEKIQRPSIGRQVRAVDYAADGCRLRTATICFVWSDDSVNLDITEHDGSHSVAHKVSYMGQEDGEHIGWCWPTRD